MNALSKHEVDRMNYIELGYTKLYCLVSTQVQTIGTLKRGKSCVA